MQHLSIDIETYSSVNLQKAGVYKYAESPDFDILLFGYSVDGGAVHVIDLACGEKIPAEIVDALSDESVIKWAFNAQFERVCLSNYLDTWLSPDSWHCTMVWSATLGLPLSLQYKYSTKSYICIKSTALSIFLNKWSAGTKSSMLNISSWSLCILSFSIIFITNFIIP